MVKFRLLISLALMSFLTGCSQQNSSIKKPSKYNGVSFVASRLTLEQLHIDPVININANATAVMPFGFIRNLDTPEIIHNTDRQWFGETEAGARQYIQHLHANNLSVMIKPQIWIWRGEFTGHLKMSTEEDWALLENSYREFIMTYARLAEEMNVAIFCVGTELEQFIVHRPAFWNQLISEIKEVYKGKLTYAANWDEYKRVPFWTALDYIGIDAYFPVSENKTPTVEEARKGWQRWKTEMMGISSEVNRKILFTEYGYRSVDFSGKEPWKSDRSMTSVNLVGQANLTQALFEEVYHEPWFAGGYIWKWFIDHAEVGGHENSQFTPQNKPVEATIKAHFKTVE